MQLNNEAASKFVTISEEFQCKIHRDEQREKWLKIAPLIVLAALLLFFSVLAPGFFSLKNMQTITTQLAVPLIVASGLTFVVLMGAIDLSADGVMGLGSAIVGMLVLNNKTSLNLGLFAIPLVLVFGALCGLITGLIHVKGKIPSFMVTYGMLSVTSGLAVVLYDAVPPTIEDGAIRSFALTKFLGFPLLVYISLAVFLILLIIQEKTAYGKYIYAIGENEAFARVSGIMVDKIKIGTFILAAVIMSVAGIMGASQIGRGDVAVGAGMTFPALAAVVLGGTSLSGGKGGVINTLVGTITITVLENGLVLMGVNPYIKSAILGIVLILALILTLSKKVKQVVK